MTRTVLAWLVISILSPAIARAQLTTGAPDPETVHVRIGPLWIKPTLALTDAGIDSNVFNESEADGPKSDFTMTLSPTARVWIGFGPTWIGGSVKEDLVWYKKFASQRAANTSTSLSWTVPLARMTIEASGSWIRTQERPGFEIDERALRSDRSYNGGVELLLFSKTFVGLRAERRTIDFDAAESFLGRNLRDELNRTESSETVTIRFALTPLTSLTFDASRRQDRFEFSSLRDANSTQGTVGLVFTPDALISGSAKVGYRNFEPTQSGLPTYRGSIAAVNVSYLARGSTKLTIQMTRDVQFSYDVDQPYYLLTGATGSIRQQIFGPIDVEGRLTSQRLSYRDRVGAIVEVSDRVDHTSGVGAGVGFHLREDLRVAFNVDQLKRTSDVNSRTYKGFRFGTEVAYGF